MLNHKVNCHPSSAEGKGLFATSGIKKGEIVWKLDTTEKALTKYERDKLPDELRKLAFQYNNKYVVVKDGSQYMNHSCDPNTWWTNDDELSARRDIKKDEEITYDYSSADIGNWAASWDCKCGTKICRERITGNDCLNNIFQKRYGNHLPSWVINYILDHGSINT